MKSDKDVEDQEATLVFWILGFLICILSVMGCATTSTHALVTSHPDGTVTQELKQLDMTPPFAKKNEAIGKMHTRKGADGTYELETGTSATGIDNTGQVAVVQAAVQAALAGYTAGLAVPRPAPKPTLIEQLTPLLPPRTP